MELKCKIMLMTLCFMLIYNMISLLILFVLLIIIILSVLFKDAKESCTEHTRGQNTVEVILHRLDNTGFSSSIKTRAWLLFWLIKLLRGRTKKVWHIVCDDRWSIVDLTLWEWVRPNEENDQQGLMWLWELTVSAKSRSSITKSKV